MPISDVQRLAFLMTNKIQFAFRIKHLGEKYFSTHYDEKVGTELREYTNKLVLFKSVTGGTLIGRITRYSEMTMLYEIATIPAQDKKLHGLALYFGESSTIKSFYVSRNQIIAVLKEMK